MTVENKINKQIGYAWVQLILFVFGWLMWILSFNSYSYGPRIGASIAFIILFIFWIIGIVNATQISSRIIGGTTYLTVLSVFTLIFGMLIAIYSVKSKYVSGQIREYDSADNFNTQNINQNRQNAYRTNTSAKDALDQALSAGVITGVEYDKKLKELKKKENES